jgi:hypothetical protein
VRRTAAGAALTEKEGFEPSIHADPHGNSVGSHRDALRDYRTFARCGNQTKATTYRCQRDCRPNEVSAG